MRWLLVCLCACTAGPVSLDTGTGTETSAGTDFGGLQVVDRAAESGYLDAWFGHLERARGTTVIDVDSDGDPDVVEANPGDTSFVMINDTIPGGPLRFRPGQVLDKGLCYWTIGAGDFDNDTDQDLFVGYGGNETVGFDFVYEHTEDPVTPFVDVTDQSGVMTYDRDGETLKHSTAGALVWDFDNDGLLDVYASSRLKLNALVALKPDDVDGLNPLWHNLGGLVFEDRGPRLGLTTQRSTRNSQFLDIENDGDLDLFEDNFDGDGSVLWRNLLVETGTPDFEDVTQEFSLGGGDLSQPSRSAAMASSATDLNNDGWEDLVVFRRGPPKTAGEPVEMSPGHLIWINVEGRGFVEVAQQTSINDSFVWRDHDAGVMGCQVADWNADGFPDIFVGNGSPSTGEVSRLYLSTVRTEVEIDGVGTVVVPQFVDATSLIDFPSDFGDFGGHQPTYPYRTHGSVAADFDGDGDLELAQNNGGAFHNETLAVVAVQEPDRMWDFLFPDPKPGWLQIDLVGDGVFVNRDAIGTKVHLTVERPDGSALDLYQVRRSQTGFAAQNQAGVHFGLGEAVAITGLEVTWPDGTVDDAPIPDLDTRIVLER